MEHPSDRPRRPRRAVRAPGTVGHDESVLRTVVPAAPATPAPSTVAPTAQPPALDDDRALPVRSLDDGDVGWGESAADSNDDRLRRDVPPHW